METEVDLLTTDEFAKSMRTTRKTVRAWIARGIIRLGEYTNPTGPILIRREALHRLTTPEEAEETPPSSRRPLKVGVKKQAANDLMNLKKILTEIDGKKRKKHGQH